MAPSNLKQRYPYIALEKLEHVKAISLARRDKETTIFYNSLIPLNFSAGQFKQLLSRCTFLNVD